MSSAIVSKGSQLYSTNNITYNLLKNSNCWIDFSDTNYYTTSGTGNVILTSVNDKSNDARTITVVGSPTFDPGLRSMYNITSGITSCLNVTTGAPDSTRKTETVFMVFSPTTNTGAFFGSTTTGYHWSRTGTTINYGLVGNNGIPSISTIRSGQLYIATFVCDNATLKIYLNGKYETTGTTSFTASGVTQVGLSGTTVLQGQLYELIFFNDALADDQRQLIEYYLYKKWKETTTTFLPSSISGCTLWLDGNDSSTITYSSGTSISRWADKSGNNYHAIQNTAARQPTYDSTTKGVNFVNTSTQFMTSSAPYTGSANEEFVYIVFKHNGIANASLLGTTDTTRGRQITTQTNRLVVFNSGTLALNSTATVTAGTVYFSEFINVSGLSLIKTNKSLIGSGAKITFATGTYTQVIGASTPTGTSLPYSGQIYEIVVFNRALTSSERSSMHNYLFSKWTNIASGPTLNSYQPYANVPPYLRLAMPTDVLGCSLWLDAADYNTFTLSGSNVTQWNDKSGSANHASGGTSPTYSTNAVVFNGTSQYLTSPYSASLSNETFFMVGTMTGSTGPDVGHTIVGSSANGGRQLLTYTTGLAVNIQNVAAGISGGTFASNQRVLFQYTRGAGNAVALFMNGNVAITGTLAAYTASLTTWIGRWPGSTADCWQGSMHEIIGYNRQLSVGERQLIEGYLTQKWGLKSYLPSTHSFKSELALSPRFNLRKFDLKLWLDAADPLNNGVTPANGTAITTWYDKSVYGYTLGNSSGNQVINYDGKYPAFYIDGTTNTLFIGASGFLTSTVFTIFTVYKTLASDAGTVFHINKVSTIGAYNYVNIRTLGTNGGMLVVYNSGTTTRKSGSTNTIDVNTRGLAVIADDGSASTLAADTFSTNGSLVTGNRGAGTSATVATCDSNLIIGQSRITSTYSNILTGYVYEIIVSLRKYSIFERQQIEGYLAWKWGFPNQLPSTHPFSKYPPY